MRSVVVPYPMNADRAARAVYSVTPPVSGLSAHLIRSVVIKAAALSPALRIQCPCVSPSDTKLGIVTSGDINPSRAGHKSVNDAAGDLDQFLQLIRYVCQRNIPVMWGRHNAPASPVCPSYDLYEENPPQYVPVCVCERR